MNVDLRLALIQAQLNQRGLRDFKLCLNPQVPMNLQHVKEDVANMLEQYLQGNVTPMPKLGDLPDVQR
jgi:hypothetical protein